MVIPRNEMIGVDGALRPRAVTALQRMTSLAHEHGGELTVQVPAEAMDAAAEIGREAPRSVIKEIAARQPFKLVLRLQPEPERSMGSQRRRGAAGPESLDDPGNGLPKVFIHVRNESQLGAAREYADRLRRLGAVVPEFEIIVADGPRRKQLRYFHSADRKEAAKLASSVEAGATFELLDLSREYAGAVPPRRYELWLPPTITPDR